MIISVADWNTEKIACVYDCLLDTCISWEGLAWIWEGHVDSITSRFIAPLGLMLSKCYSFNHECLVDCGKVSWWFSHSFMGQVSISEESTSKLSFIPTLFGQGLKETMEYDGMNLHGLAASVVDYTCRKQLQSWCKMLAEQNDSAWFFSDWHQCQSEGTARPSEA